MHLGQLRPPRGAKKDRKRIGRGNASGQGTYAGKGLKGQKARSGPMPYAGFEGGQWPLIRKLARVGFVSPNRVEYEIVKISDLARFSGDEVGPEQLMAAGVVKRPKLPVKVLSNGEISRPITVRAHRFTETARAKIEAAGGRVEEIDGPHNKKRKAKAARAAAAGAEQTGQTTEE
jgi:large subunit ribosomal protein L15